MIFLNCAVVGCVEKLKFLAYFKHCLLLVVKLEFFFQLKQFKAPSAWNLLHYHYQKSTNTNENIERIFLSVYFLGILPMKIFPRYVPRELQWEKKLKQSKKKTTCHFYQQNYLRNLLWILFIMSITKGITDETFRRYFSESSEIVHFSIALLIIIIHEQNHQHIEKSSVLFGDFLKKFN